LSLAGDIFEGFRRENDEYVEMGEWLIVVGRWIGTAKGSGVPIDQRTVNAMRIRDGQVLEWSGACPTSRRPSITCSSAGTSLR
jgi:hypothetical protein